MWLNAVIWFVLGLVVGSFLNVVIYRIPRKIKLHDPSRSFCPHCGATIAWYDNIPLLSYLILKGRCRNCGDPISPRYPLVELLTALGFMAGGLVFDTLGALFNALVVASLVVLTFIDLETLTIPDTSVIIVLIAGLMWNVLKGEPWYLHLLTGAVVLVLAYLLAFFSKGLGMGDVKLLGAMGVLLGAYGTLFAVLVASVAGSIVALYLLARKRVSMKTKIPFGPFLALGTFVSLYLSERFFALLGGS